jgi:PiT family inorganic phosphate transporter
LLILLSSFFDLLNGLRDASNFVSTIISTRTLSPRKALAMAAVSEFSGPFIFGVAVARTFGRDLVAAHTITVEMILAALVSGILWNLATLALGIPSSSSHAFLGGILGAVILGAGPQAILIGGLSKIMIALFISPLLGLVIGYLITQAVYLLSRQASPRVNHLFRLGQIPAAIGMAMGYGANDAQKTMGMITLALVTTGYLDHFQVPIWVEALSAGSIAVGMAIGGWSLIRTLGGKFYNIRPVHGFSAQAAAALVVLSAAVLGGPASTTQVVTSSILGAGSAERVNQVRWNVAGGIVMAWLLTIPICALIGAGVLLVL